MDWGALAQGIGSMVSAWGSYKQESLNRDFAQYQFERNLQQQDTAHQREVKDLTAAGLNPILSGTGGGGAPTGGGIGLSPVGIPDLGQGLGSAYATYRANKKLDAELDLIKENVINTGVDTERKESEVLLNRALASQALQGAHTAFSTKQQIDSLKKRTDFEAAGQLITNRLLRNQLPGSDVERKIDESTAGSVSRFIKRFLPAANSASTLMYRAR